jgi:hypothetical protein
MAGLIPLLLVLVALLDATALYAILVARRVHERRLARRLEASAHLYGLVRVTLADRRTA